MTDQLQQDLERLYPDSCHGIISLTPPSEEAAQRIISIFNLNCSADVIVKSLPINFKEKL